MLLNLMFRIDSCDIIVKRVVVCCETCVSRLTSAELSWNALERGSTTVLNAGSPFRHFLLMQLFLFQNAPFQTKDK